MKKRGVSKGVPVLLHHPIDRLLAPTEEHLSTRPSLLNFTLAAFHSPIIASLG